MKIVNRFQSLFLFFLFLVVGSFGQAAPCGLNGSLDERIEDCSTQKKGFVLVTRSEDLKEVYKDVSTGLLWSDTLPSTMDHFNAEMVCNSSLKEVAGIPGFTWRLPSDVEYWYADFNGIMALPNMKYLFWSSTLYGSKSDMAKVYVGRDEASDTDVWNCSGNGDPTQKRCYRTKFFSVRCVASTMKFKEQN